MCGTGPTTYLEKHESDTVAAGEGTSDELSQDLEGDGDTRHSLDVATRQNGDERHDDTIHHYHGRGMSRVRSNARHTDRHGDHEEDAVPPFRDFGVSLHKSEVDVFGQIVLLGFGSRGTTLAKGLLEALDGRTKAHCQVVSVEDDHVRQC